MNHILKILGYGIGGFALLVGSFVTFSALTGTPMHEVKGVGKLFPEQVVAEEADSTMLPDGPQPLAMLFASSVKQYPVAIDVHKVAVVGDFAMAHVNFRNLDTADPADLGIAAVDMYLFGEDGKVVEHWDTLQNVPTHSANPNTMFLKLYEEDK